MMANPNINYTSTNFEYPTLTKIQWISTYEPLRRIKNKLKANTASVHCDLGCGAYEHLGLMLTVPESENISQIGYIWLLHPGTLDITTGTKIKRLQDARMGIKRLLDWIVRPIMLNQAY